MSMGSSGGDPNARGGSLLVGGRYRMDAKIGEGGMGAVYRAVDAKTGRTVALKLLLDADEKSLARFRREARSAAELRHPNIVGLLDFDIDDPNGAYIVMELVDGTSLAALLAREGRLDPARAVGIARQLFSALGHAHAAGILHRDVKPGNILVSATDAVADFVRLVDFGLAKHTDPAKDLGIAVTTMPAMLGTPAYMPPEQMMGETLDARADLYAAGLVLYRMLAGGDAYPMSGADRVVAVMSRSRGRPLQALAPWVDPALAALVDACISPDKSQRPGSAQEIIDGLGATLSAARGSNPTQSARASAPSMTYSAPTVGAPGAHDAPTQAPFTAYGAPTVGGAAPLALTIQGTLDASSSAGPPSYAGPHSMAGPPSMGSGHGPVGQAGGPFVLAQHAAATPRSPLVLVLVFAFVAIGVVGALGLGGVLLYMRSAASTTAGQDASIDAGVSVAVTTADASTAASPSGKIAVAPTRASSTATGAATKPVSPANPALTAPGASPPATGPASANCSCVFRSGLKLCTAAQTPLCRCGGAICRTQWANNACGSGLESFGGAGKKSGDRCSGFELATFNGKSTSSPADGTLTCNMCSTPSRFSGVNGAPCKGINNSGTESDGVLSCQ